MHIVTFYEDDAKQLCSILISNGIAFSARSFEKEMWGFEFEPPDEKKIANEIKEALNNETLVED